VSVGAGVKRSDNEFKYATNYFSEDYIDSEDIMKLWPKGWGDAPTSNIDTDEYVNDFLTALNSGTWIVSVSGPNQWYQFDHKKREALIYPPPSEPSISTEIAISHEETGVIEYREKRFARALFTQIAKFFGRLGGWLARNELRRLKTLKNQGGLKVAEKGKGAAFKDQVWTGKQVTKSKNWKNCLNGLKPESY
jgi:hypothetical protein